MIIWKAAIFESWRCHTNNRNIIFKQIKVLEAWKKGYPFLDHWHWLKMTRKIKSCIRFLYEPPFLRAVNFWHFLQEPSTLLLSRAIGFFKNWIIPRIFIDMIFPHEFKMNNQAFFNTTVPSRQTILTRTFVQVRFSIFEELGAFICPLAFGALIQ